MKSIGVIKQSNIISNCAKKKSKYLKNLFHSTDNVKKILTLLPIQRYFTILIFMTINND